MLTKKNLKRVLQDDDITSFKQLINDRETLVTTLFEHMDFAVKIINKITSSTELFNYFIKNKEDLDEIIKQWLANPTLIDKIADLNKQITDEDLNPQIKNEIISYILKNMPLFDALIMDCSEGPKSPYIMFPFKFLTFIYAFPEFESQLIDKWLQIPKLVKAILRDNITVSVMCDSLPSKYTDDIKNSYLLHSYAPIKVIDEAIKTKNFKLIDKVNETLVDKKLSNSKYQKSWQAIRKEISEKIKALEDIAPLKTNLTNLSATISTTLVPDLRTLSLFVVKQKNLDPSCLPGDLQSELDDIKEGNTSNCQFYG